MVDPEIAKIFINALAKIVAGNTGVIEKISAREAGIQAAMEDRVKDAGTKYLKNQISKEETRRRIKETLIASSLTPLIEKVKEKIDESEKVNAVVGNLIEKASSLIKNFSKKSAEKLRHNKKKHTARC